MNVASAVDTHPLSSAAQARKHAPKPSVLHVLEATSAGAARYVADVLMNIDTGAFDVCFAYSPIRSDDRFREDLERIRNRGVATCEIPMVRQIDPVADARAFWQLRQLMCQQSFDLVHAHSSKAGFLARLAARSVSSRMITVYSPHAICISVKPRYRHLERFAALFTDALLGVSRSECDELDQYKLVPRRKLHFVTAAVEIQTYREWHDSSIREKFGLPASAVLIGTAGRLSVQKDPFTFLEVARIVLATEPNAHFIWIGDGELRAETLARARQLKIDDRILFPGYTADVKPWLAALDIFVLTSRYESFGYATCEAMALAKPVVATRVAGSCELVTSGETGYLAAPGSAEALAAYVTLLVRDSALRAKFGKAGRMKAEKMYNLDRMIADLERVYRGLLSARPQRA